MVIHTKLSQNSCYIILGVVSQLFSCLPKAAITSILFLQPMQQDLIIVTCVTAARYIDKIRVDQAIGPDQK
ncbi:hypothetical protein BDW75DRAFT_226679 [Aspergillus navahoensis]